jgi:hypothetical protein
MSCRPWLFVVAAAVAVTCWSSAKAEDPPLPINLPKRALLIPQGGGSPETLWANGTTSATGDKPVVKGGGAGHTGSVWRSGTGTPEENVVVAFYSSDSGSLSMVVTRTETAPGVFDFVVGITRDGTQTVYDLAGGPSPLADPGCSADFKTGPGVTIDAFGWAGGSATLVADVNSDGLRELVVGGVMHPSEGRAWDPVERASRTTWSGGFGVWQAPTDVGADWSGTFTLPSGSTHSVASTW